MNSKPLWQHQVECIERAKERDTFALFHEPGTGKSRTTIEILRHKYAENGRILRTIIFAPPIVLRNWKEEWALYSHVEPRNVQVLSGSGAQRLKLFNVSAYNTEHRYPENRIFVTNYETLLMEEVFAAFLNWAPEALVFDESHKLKNHSANRSKLAHRLAQKSRYKYILTGTPVLNSPLDLFQQYKVMDNGLSFGDNYFGFRARYFHDKNANIPKERYFPNWQVRPGAIDELNQTIQETGMRAEKSECLDLPPLVTTTIKVEMAPKQAKAYKELAKEFITFVEDKACTAQLAIVKALRLMQVTSGFIALEPEGKEDDLIQHRFEATPKLLALKELLEEFTPHTKVLIWAVWRENYEQIRELCGQLKIRMVEVHGSVSPSARDAAVKAFTDEQEVRVFLGHPGSGGIGINLCGAGVGIFYSRTFSLEHLLQAEARNYRGGSREAGHSKITHIHLVCENTIDELAVERLNSKEAISESLLKTMVKL